MAQVLPVVFTIVHPDGLIIEVRGTVDGNTTSGGTHPVEFCVVVTVVAGNVLSRTTQSVRIADDTVAPVGEAGTHHVISGEVLVVGVRNHHDGLLVGRVGDVGSTMQVPYDIAGHLPCILSTRRLPGSEVLCHQLQAVIVDQVCSDLLCFGILTDSEVALHEQMHASFLIDLTYKRHL